MHHNTGIGFDICNTTTGTTDTSTNIRVGDRNSVCARNSMKSNINADDKIRSCYSVENSTDSSASAMYPCVFLLALTTRCTIINACMAVTVSVNIHI